MVYVVNIYDVSMLSFIPLVLQRLCVIESSWCYSFHRLDMDLEVMSLFFPHLLLTTDNIEVGILSSQTFYLFKCKNKMRQTNILLNLIARKLDKGVVLKAICAGFQETTEPTIFLSEGELLYGWMNSSYIAIYLEFLGIRHFKIHY